MKNISVVYFSPTGGTRKACLNLAQGLGEDVREVDLCGLEGECSFGPEDLVVVGAPVFGGRIPAFAAEKIKCLHGSGAVAVTAAVYGNRAFEDALLELGDCLKEQGFKIGAGAALLAEHSMVRDIGAGRPDEKDAQEMKSFGIRIREKLENDGWQEPRVPGDHPYREWSQMPVVPMTGDACTACGLCARQCPLKAISASEPAKVDPGKCILCMRCVSVCPVRAKSLPPQVLAMLEQKLSPVREIRRENELFL